VKLPRTYSAMSQPVTMYWANQMLATKFARAMPMMPRLAHVTSRTYPAGAVLNADRTVLTAWHARLGARMAAHRPTDAVTSRRRRPDRPTGSSGRFAVHGYGGRALLKKRTNHHNHRRVSVSETPGDRGRVAASTLVNRAPVSVDASSSGEQHAREAALHTLTTSAVSNIAGVDFASVTISHQDRTLHTVAATDPVAEQIDSVQYELREGPCYAAVTNDRLVLLNDVAATTDFPRYGPRAFELGVRGQLAIQLFHNGERAGLNLYARKPEAFDRSTVQLAEMFATQAAWVLGYAKQVDQLHEALHTRTDIGTAVGIVMERYGVDRDRAFEFLVRTSMHRNVKVREIAQQIAAGTFETELPDDAPQQ
jgi:hypothetical protein